jgi:hypothetical protein
MNLQEQNKIRNYLIRRVDYPTLESIIDQNFRYAENEFDQDDSFYNFNNSIAAIIVEDLHIMDYIDLHIEQMYDKLVEYFSILLKDRTRKLYNRLTNNQQEMKEGELTEKCWKGYTQKGMKTMFGKRYPNCVKKTK